MAAGGAFQCRADARHHGDVQRLVRPHAGHRARRHRPGRRREAAALDRLDPHRARPGRAGARLHQMGRPAGARRRPRAKRSCAATWIANTAPHGPVYINLDAELQEAKLAEPLPPLDAARFTPRGRDRGAAPHLVAARPRAADRREAARSCWSAACRAASDAWNARVALAEAAQCARHHRSQDRRELPDRPSAACRRRPASSRRRTAREALRAADVILSLDWVDLAGTLDSSAPAAPPRRSSRSRSTMHPQRLEHGPSGPAAGRSVRFRPIPMPSCAACSKRSAPAAKPRAARTARAAAKPRETTARPRRNEHLARVLQQGVATAATCLTHLPLSWNGRLVALPPSARLHRLRRRRRHRRRAGHLGRRRAGAARASGRLPVAICGDGDFLMGVTALWTAAHYRIPLLFVVANNRSFFNDEVHQERMARACAAARSRTSGSASAWATRRSISPRWRARKARSASARSRRRRTWRRSLAEAHRRRRCRARSPSSTCACSPATRPRWPPR